MTINRTLFDLLSNGADQAPALIAPGGPVWSFADLRSQVQRLAEWLQNHGLGHGDRIAIALGNGPAMAITFLAAATAATAAPLNPKYRREEFAFYYEDTNARALIVAPNEGEEARAALRPGMMLIEAAFDDQNQLRFVASGQAAAPRRDGPATADDIAMILHTSGTTSRPKRVPLRHRNLVASTANIIATYQLSAADRSLCVMPLFHIHGIVASLLSQLAAGGAVICPSWLRWSQILELDRAGTANLVLGCANDAPGIASPRQPQHSHHCRQSVPLYPLVKRPVAASGDGTDGTGFRSAGY
jgi:acyl-CoA synthetase (AMP-forming)/AMP-acid ligase II